jgi:4-hydroxy-4-methyl-2-oxoglutarate aldolase
VNPGDIVVGDADGVVVVPANAAGDVAMKAKKREESEAAIRERLRAGETTMKIYGFDQLLAKKGVK